MPYTMSQQSGDAAAKAVAFANGLRGNVSAAGRRWTHWPRGADDLVLVLGRIDGIKQQLQSGSTDAAAAILDLRTILEWSQYQTASLTTAQAILTARKTKAMAERLGLLDETASPSILGDSEDALVENVATRTGYMVTLAEKFPHLGLPPPLVGAQTFNMSGD